MFRALTLTAALISLPAFAQSSSGTASSGSEAAPAATTTEAAAATADGDAKGQRMIQSFIDEGKAMRDLAVQIKKEVAAGTVKVAPEAVGQWDAGAALWQEVQDLGAAGKEKEAYEKLRELRKLFGSSLGTVFSGTVSPEVRAGLKSWWQVLSPRIDHIVAQGKAATDLTPEVKAHYKAGQQHWQDAKAAAEAKEFAKAYTEMLKGVDELDHVIWLRHKGQ